MMVLRVLGLLAFLLVPGWLAAALLEGRKRHYPAERKEKEAKNPDDEYREGILDGREKLFLAAVLGTGIVSLCALALALASAYRLWSLAALVGLVCIPMAALGRGRLSWPLRVGRNEYLVCLALVAVALAVSVPPGRTVFGWSDVGVYADISAHIVREGGVVMDLPAIREIAPEHRNLVFKENEDPNLPFKAFWNKAFPITDIESGRVLPIFYWLWPSFMAVFASFLRPGSMFWAVTAAAVLALWGFWLLSRRLLGWRWGLAATSLMAVSPLFVYFSRYTTSEMMNLALFVAGSLVLTVFLDTGRKGTSRDGRNMALVAAFFFTLGFLCRIDFIMVLVPLVLFFLGKRFFKGLNASDKWFCGATAAGAAMATAVGAIFSYPYFRSIFGGVYGAITNRAWQIAVFLIAPFMVFSFGARLRVALRRLRKYRIAWIALLGAGLAALFVYQYFIRPGIPSASIDYGVVSVTSGPSYDNQTMVRWGWYFSFLGLVLMFIGYGLWFTHKAWHPGMPVALMAFTATFIFSWNMRTFPQQIMVMRRLVPMVLAGATLAMVFALKEVGSILAGFTSGMAFGRWVAGLTAFGALSYLFVFSTGASVPIIGLCEGGNQLEICGDIAGNTQKDAVVIMDYALGDLFGPPLRCFYGVENAWLMENSAIEGKGFAGLFEDLGFPGRQVYILWRPEMSGREPSLPPGFRAVEVGSFFSREEMLEKSFDKRPSLRTNYSYSVRLFRLEAGEEGGKTK